MSAAAPVRTSVQVPARYAVTVRHQRRDPLRYGLEQRDEMWLVDLDALPTMPRGLGRLVRFDPRDHLGDPTRSIRANLDAFLAERGTPRPDRVLLLAHPRVLGHAFDPLSVFYCYRDGVLTEAVAEVRNTYGGRHCYLLHPDEHGRADVDKAFYVSPFHPVDGAYVVSVPEPGERLAVSITLHRPHAAPFTASMVGERRPVRRGLVAALRRPFTTWAVSAGIRWHGVRLYLAGLRPYPRTGAPEPTHPGAPRRRTSRAPISRGER